jgi:hypothetical protein
VRPIICDRCGDRIDDEWTGPLLEIKVSNGVDNDVAGDYCVDCAGTVAEAVREVITDE